jgi:hypothetical protein
MKKLILFFLLFFSCLILISCSNDGDNSSSQNTVNIAPEILADVKVEFQDEDGSAEGDLTLKSDGSAILFQMSGWMSSNYFGSYVYGRQTANTGVIHASYTLLETSAAGNIVSESTNYVEEYTLYFDNVASGSYSKMSGTSDIDGTFIVVAIE